MLFESLHLLFRAMNKPGDKFEDFLMSKTNRGCSTFFPFSTLLPPYSDIPTFYHVLHIKYRPKEGKGGQPLIQANRCPPLSELQREIMYYFLSTRRGEGTERNFDRSAAKCSGSHVQSSPGGAEQGYC